jgi:hypothetical protein
LHVWIIDSAILQLPPQRVHLQCIGIFAQRLRLKTVVELLQLRQLGAVWRRRGAYFLFLLLLFWKEIHRRRRRFLSVHHQRGNQQRAQKD